MKMARMAFKDIGPLKALEIKDLSPGLNLMVGPTGSGKSTIRRAIGGLFYGFDEANRRRLINETRDTARGSMELLIGKGSYQLERYRDNWNASADALRNISSGTSSQSLSRNLGNLRATDYFTFFNFSLVDSPDQERRMVRSLNERLGITQGASHWDSEADFLRWRNEAQDRHQQLEELETRQRHLIARRDQLKQEMSRSENGYTQRLSEVDSQLEAARDRWRAVKERVASLESERSSLEHSIQRTRQELELQPTGQFAEPRPDRLSVLYKRLDRIGKEIQRTRAVQRDISRRRSELRDQRMGLSDHEAKVRNGAATGARQHLSQLEDRLEHLSKVLREVVRYDREHYQQTEGWQEQTAWIESQANEQFDQAREDLYTLCEDMSRYHLQMVRGRMSAEGRDLRRCHQEMKRRVAWLKMRRQQILHDIKELDPAGHELIQRGEKRFCDCARHAGHLEARRRFLESPTVPCPASQPDTSVLEAELHRLLSRLDRVVADWQIADDDCQRCRSEVDRWNDERQRILESLDIESLRHQWREVERDLESLDQELSRLRERVAKDHPLWNLRYDNLLDRASQLCRQLTGGSIYRIWIDRTTERLMVKDAEGQSHTFDALGRSDQDLICLSLSLSVARRMKDEGHAIPLVYDDLFVNLDDPRTEATCEVLYHFAADGYQIILFANGRQIDERLVIGRFQRTPIPEPAVYYLPDLKDLSLLEWPVVLEPGVRTRPLALPQPVISTPVISTRLPMIISEATSLYDLDLIERDALAILSENHILTVGDLLDLEPEELSAALTSRGITAQRVDRWQSQAWILCCVPGLRPYDARLLVGSGITEPEMLDELDAHDVLDRLEGYLATGEGQRVMRSGTDYELARVNSWMRSLRDNRSSWRSGHSREGRSRYQRRRRSRSYDYPSDSYVRPEHDYAANGQVRLHKEREDDDGRPQLVFHLNLEDDLERAPSIGPRMAERFAKLGIHTVQQFLAGEVNDMARRLDHRRVDEKTLVDWQHQARLVCRIPNLRGHDAQLLVACDIIDPETLLRMKADDLYAIVVPFAETREGQKILRSSKSPDMDEINDWIRWAKQHRSLQVA